MRCSDVREGLATLAEGGDAPEAAAHAATCDACAARLAQLRRVVAAARTPVFDAPADLVARARGLMAGRPRARVLGSSLGFSGARRGASDEVSARISAGGVEVPLQYVRVSGGWEVLGRAPGWTASRDGVDAPGDAAGRFRLWVPSLEDAAFVLRSADGEFEVPSPAEWEAA